MTNSRFTWSKQISKSPDWLEKSRPFKKATFALIM